MNELRINHDLLGKLGSGSIIGILADKGFLHKKQPIKILFKTRNLSQCREHGGPDSVIIPEFVPMCLCDDIVTLIGMGEKLEFGEYHDEDE